MFEDYFSSSLVPCRAHLDPEPLVLSLCAGINFVVQMVGESESEGVYPTVLVCARGCVCVVCVRACVRA